MDYRGIVLHQNFVSGFEKFHIDKRNALICIVSQSEAEDWILGICKIPKIVPHRPLLGILQPCLRILLPSSLSPNPSSWPPPSPTLSSSWSSASWGLRRQSLRPHSLECYSQCLDLTAFSPSTAPQSNITRYPPHPSTSSSFDSVNLDILQNQCEMYWIFKLGCCFWDIGSKFSMFNFRGF